MIRIASTAVPAAERVLAPGVSWRETWGGAMYDFGSSSYTTTVITAIFNAYFVAVVAGAQAWATLAWTASLAVSNLLGKASCRAAIAPRHWVHARIGIAAAFFCIPPGHAQELPSDLAGPQPMIRENHAFAVPPMDSRWRSGQQRAEAQDDFLVRQRTLGIMIGNSLALALYGSQNWWQDGFNSRFRTVNEGWFGQQTYSGGADKLGHFYMNYAGTRLFARAFEWSGNDAGQSLRLAAWLTSGTFTAVEVLDGFSKKWRFSKEDVIMNAAGVGAALLLERNPELDRILDLRFLYRPSRENGAGFDPFGDYSGQTYLFVVKACGISALRNHPWLRYVEVAVGYGTRGYSNSAAAGGDSRSRNIYAGVSLNLSELLNGTVFRNSAEERRAQRLVNTALEFVQVPGTAVLAKHRLRAD